MVAEGSFGVVVVDVNGVKVVVVEVVDSPSDDDSDFVVVTPAVVEVVVVVPVDAVKKMCNKYILIIFYAKKGKNDLQMS